MSLSVCKKFMKTDTKLRNEEAEETAAAKIICKGKT